MNTPTLAPERVRDFLLSRYADQIKGKGISIGDVPDGFDFLLEGIIDSFGVLELVGVLESEFGIELDMSGLDAEQMTLLGPLARYVAEQANARGTGTTTNPPSS